MKLTVTLEVPEDFFQSPKQFASRLQRSLDNGWPYAPMGTVEVVAVTEVFDPALLQPIPVLDRDAQCPDHGCARWRCDGDHEVLK